ncbi:hypothetical protein SKAU_G00117570 [Synaphobranchus kaupii]|uniref:B30.2/SPRY domain-containing protein n=1 Tax=Synaphobranchus kaupii TaxID=118154 RepID=A0A9Q1FND9_SYNKA|nr:hypothetical protein SKAU_G00117570 [Synaphobranchus kaupii]
MIDAGQHYWEVWFDKDSKAFGAGVALRSLGRFDQLGKSSRLLVRPPQQLAAAELYRQAQQQGPAPWTAPSPTAWGVYCSYDEGVLSFYNARSKQPIHTFRTKFTQPIVPAFMVWNGSFSVQTGLQVPSVVQNGQRRSSGTSSSNASPQLEPGPNSRTAAEPQPPPAQSRPARSWYRQGL